ncbi:MAG: hypothetical protein PW789_11295 [Edaphobacter sp.]|uniref:hypothetical protein n=1 Tax=Edaphobacter sp. TaxID=1934404 RepID=UPI002382A01C|nr:hypothetical protein [Edaphobacter sp.]MDE1177170.1 hypothetical protein [Edaphobacter sp.]
MPAKLKKPELLVSSSRRSLLLSSVRTTCALGTMAPVLSSTVPVRLAVVCAWSASGVSRVVRE